MAENLKSNPITNLDAQPIVVMTAGEGAPGTPKFADDVVNPTASVVQWSTYRLTRFPTNAKVKHVWAYMTGIDSNAAAGAVLDFNVAFSDSPTDGTPNVLQGTIPSNKHDGTSLAFVAGTGYSTSYANSGTGNKLFGQLTGANSGTQTWKEITFNNTTASQGFFPANRDDDLWNYLGFVNNAGLAQDPGGFFDILAVVSTGPSTAAAGVLAVEVDYIV